MSFEHFKLSLKGKRLLIVEDEALQREYINDEAQSLIRCDTAASFEEAINKLKAADFDYLLSDVHLTTAIDDQSEGLKVMSFAKQNIPGIKVVAMTTDNSIQVTNYMDHLVIKPLLDTDTIARALFQGRNV